MVKDIGVTYSIDTHSEPSKSAEISRGSSEIKHIKAAANKFINPYVDTEKIIEELPVSIIIFNKGPHNKINTLYANQAACDLFDITHSFRQKLPIEKLWSKISLDLLSKHIEEAYSTGINIQFEWTVQFGAIERHLYSQMIPLMNTAGEIYQIICTSEDHTAEKMAEHNLIHHAFHDTLTGLPNRVLFRTKLDEAVTECEGQSDIGCAVLAVNIDRFQQVNDSFGHDAGDRFLVSISSTIRRCIRTGDHLARLSGDEFAVLISRCRDLGEIDMVCKRIHEAMESPYDIDGNEIFSSVSIGVASSMSTSAHPEDLIRDADFAMHCAKRAGKARTEVFKRDSLQQVRSQFHLETELRRAVERNELELYYQPIIDMNTYQLHGFEALTRWIHKDKGFISPVEFIPLAEETGIIVPLGRWAMYEAARQAKKWNTLNKSGSGYSINVNVSGVQFARDNVATLTSNALKKADISGDLLCVELTETAIMGRPAHISETLKKIRSLGVKVALDDFGTGYSSLNYLHQFPIDIIKIDRSFIMQMEEGNDVYKILDLISSFANTLGHKLVAEGLEDLNHVNMLENLGFRFAQGFYFSKPLTAKDADALVIGNLPWCVVPD